uniref:DUF2345 domain-containing protein n=1 Tax=Psychrobacter sp. Pi2-51 TaxID=2774132 RepID=UPI001917C4A4
KPVAIQAQGGELQLNSQQGMTIGSESGQVNVSSPKRIKLQTSAGASITIDESGIKLVCPGTIKVKAVKKGLVSGARANYALPMMPKTIPLFSNKLDVYDLFYQHNFNDIEFQILRPDGQLIEGVLDEHGRTAPVISDKACMFYLSFTKIGYKALLVSSGYRCIVRNVQKGRKSVNHMGQALDVQFSRVSNGAIANSVADVEKIREVILVKSMGAEYRWDKKNEISLETTADGASSWVHFDSREYEQKYKKLNFYAKTVAEMVGSDLSTHTDNKMLACGGTFITKNKTKNMKSIGGIIGKIIASHENQGGRYDIFNRGTIGEYAWTSGYENIEARTIDEWRKLGTLSGDNKDKRFAMGKYQIIPDTLGEVQKSLKLLGSTKLTPETQELMFLEHFVKKTNIITAIKSGSNKDIESATMKIAKIWASVGVPFATSRIAKKKAENGKLVSYTIDLKRGQSYWSGTGGNQAHTSPALAIKALKDMNNDYKTLISQGSSSEEAFDKVMSVDTKLF